MQALEKAVALDPGYAPAWAALSLAHFFAYDQDPIRHDPAQAIPRARAAAEKAIVLAPGFAGGYSTRGSLRVSWDYDSSGARADLERALSLNPGEAGVLISYAWLLATLGKLPEAIAAGRKAVALDPLSSESWTQLSAHYLGTEELDLAEAAAKRALNVSPEQARAARNLGFAYLLQGRLAEARAAFQRSSSDVFDVMGEALVEYQLGHGAEAQRALAQILATPEVIPASYQIAQVYAWRGEADGAFEWLESAYSHHDAGLGYLKYDPFLRKVRGDARYAALLRKMNLPID